MTDFDGTLAPIVDEPQDARPAQGAAQVLRRLSERFGVVGVVSGRPVQFLASRLAGAGEQVRLFGVYGTEWMERGELRRAPEVERWSSAIADTLAAAERSAPEGVAIEGKSASVTLHWRAAPQHRDWAQGFARTWSQDTGLQLRPGRMSLELFAPLGIDKGSVVERLASGCRAASFMGDDAGDLAAFEALERLSAGGVQTVKVAVADDESPQELLDSADMVVSGPDAALSLLDELARMADSRLPG